MIARKRLYIAAPLFSVAERSFNATLKTVLIRFVDVFLPQDDGLLLSELLARNVDLNDAIRAVFECDINAVQTCDGLLIVLDGRAVDEGAAFELGLAYAAKKTCVGLQTDPRRLFAIGNNPMLTGALSMVATDLDMLVEWVSAWA